MNLSYPNEISWESNIVKFGQGLFETMLFRNGRLHYFLDHMDRIDRSSKILDVGQKFIPSIKQQLLEGVFRFQENSVVRLTLSNDGFGISTRQNPYSMIDYQKGFNLYVYPYFRGESPIYEHKTVCYMENLLCQKFAEKKGYDSSIFIGAEKNILETTYANLFFLKNKSFIFPEKGYFLDGIMQKNIKRILKINGYILEERKIFTKDLVGYDAAFICNSVMGMMPVNKIDDIYFPVDSQFAYKINGLIESENR